MNQVREPGTWSRTRSPDELEIDRRVLQRIESGESTLYIRRVFSLLDRLGVDMELRQR